MGRGGERGEDGGEVGHRFLRGFQRRVSSTSTVTSKAITRRPGAGESPGVPTQDRPEVAAREARAPALQRIAAPFARLTGMAAGRSYALSRWIYLRALGLIYLIAFVPLWLQLQGLIGPEGILPAQGLLDAVRAQTGAERYYMLPTVFWLGAGARA